MENEITLMQIMDRFSTEDAAREYFERILWPKGPTCPHCGNADAARIYKMAPNAQAKVRNGLYKCAECGQQFTVTVGTVLEDTHIPLNKWLMAFYIMCASKTQVAALQLQRQLELGSYRTALFLCHRIRYAMKEAEPQGKLGGTVEADETYVGGKVKGRGRAYKGNKTPVVSMVERDGEVRSQVVHNVTGKGLAKLLKANVKKTAHLNTDESTLYTKAGEAFASHDTVNHSEEEFSRKDKKTGRRASTNTVEGYFGNTKRSIDGTHHHVSEKHLPLYVAELDYKYNTRKDSDGSRTMTGIKKAQGKRLMLKQLVEEEG